MSERSTPAAARGALAGAAAAALWAALEAPLSRALGTRGFGDVRMVGRLLGGERLWAPVGLAVHVANGAAFGALFAAAGGRGPRAALAWTAAESLAAWPALALIDRVHPDRRSGRWPRLMLNRRVLAQEAATHALFGVVLGLLLPPEGPGEPPPAAPLAAP